MLKLAHMIPATVSLKCSMISDRSNIGTIILPTTQVFLHVSLLDALGLWYTKKHVIRLNVYICVIPAHAATVSPPYSHSRRPYAHWPVYLDSGTLHVISVHSHVLMLSALWRRVAVWRSFKRGIKRGRRALGLAA